MPNSNEYMRQYMKDRYHRRRMSAIEQLGGRCIDCGTDSDLAFDHRDPSTKNFSMARILAGGSEKKVQEELAKCVLRCQPCHIKKTYASGDHLTNRTGSYPCRWCERIFTDHFVLSGHSRWCKYRPS